MAIFKPDIVLLQETRLTPTIPGYTTYEPQDPCKQIATLVRNDLAIRLIAKNADTDAHFFTIEVVTPIRSKAHDEQKIYITNLYSFSKALKGCHFSQIFSQRTGRRFTHLVARDFNAKHTAWGYEKCHLKGKVLESLIHWENFTLLNDPYSEMLRRQLSSEGHKPRLDTSQGIASMPLAYESGNSHQRSHDYTHRNCHIQI